MTGWEATGWLGVIGTAFCLLLPTTASAEIPQVVSLAANPSPATVSGKTKITATISPLHWAYRVEIKNKVNGDGIAGCPAYQSTCTGEVTIPWSENADPKDLQIEAEVVPNYGSSTGNGVSLAVPVEPFEWQFSLKAAKNPITVGEGTALETVGIYPDTAWTGYHTKIWNDDTGQLIATCFGYTCAPTVSFPYSMQLDAGAVPVHAEIVRESAPYDVAGRAEMTLLVDPLRFGLGMSFSDPQTDWKGERTWMATVSATPKLLSTPFTVSVRNVNGGTPGGCVLYETCGYRLGPGTWRATIEDEEGVYAATRWWTVPPSSTSGAEPQEESADGLDLIALAAMFPSATAACNAILVLPGTHLANSSVTDQYLACDAAVSAGASTAAALRAAAAAAGGTTILWLLWEEQTKEQTDPEQFEPEEEGEPLPVPPIVWPGGVSSEAEMLRELNPEKLSARDSEVVAKQCLRLTTRAALPIGRCTELPIFASGDLDVPQATRHDLEALLRFPGWVKLNYEDPKPKPNRTWYNAYSACSEEEPRLRHCHEFPFFSTEQGGSTAHPRPSLKLIAPLHNRRQGAKLNGFYRACGVSIGKGKPFLNVPMPHGSNVPTLILCNGNS